MINIRVYMGLVMSKLQRKKNIFESEYILKCMCFFSSSRIDVGSLDTKACFELDAKRTLFIDMSSQVENEKT